MTRLNVKLLVILAISLVVLTTGIVVVHGIQMGSSIDGLLRRAEKAKQDDSKTALQLYHRYHTYKPDDVEHHADFAMYAGELALKPGATGQELGTAIGTAIRELEDVLRGTAPADRETALRRKLIDVYMMPVLRRYSDAKEHLLILNKKNQNNAETDLQLALCQVATGRPLEAVDLLYSQIGYDPKTKKFDIEKASAPTELGAYDMLVQVLRDKLIDAQLLDRKQIADRVLEQAVIANPKSAKAYLLQVRFAKDRTAAKPAIEKALELEPEDADVLAHAAEVEFSAQEFDKADAIVAKANKLYPKDERFYLYSVIMAGAQKKSEQANERLAAGLKEIPNSLGLLTMQFNNQLNSKDLDAAQVTLKLISNTRISAPERQFLEAQVLVAKGDMKTAAQRLKALKPVFAKIPAKKNQIETMLIQCASALGQTDVVTRGAEQDPNSIQGAFFRAQSLAAQGKTREALDIFEKLAEALEKQEALAKGGPIVSAILQLRIVEQLAKPKEDRDWQPVDTWLAKMRGLNILKPPADSLIEAEVLIRKGEDEKATAMLQDLQAKFPTDGSIAGLRAAMLLQAGKQDEALKFIESCPPELRNSPALIGAKIEAQFVEGRATDEVKSSLTKISDETLKQKLAPETQSRVHSALAGAFLRVNDRAGAELELKKAGELQPKEPRIRWTLFDIARQTGDLAAMKALQDWFVKEFGREDSQSKLAEAAIMVAKVRAGLVEKFSDQPDQLVLSTADQQNLTKARDLLREVELDRPGWAEQPRLLAEINVLENRQDDAISNLQEVLSQGQAYGQTVKQLVTLLHIRRRDAEAAELLKKYSNLVSGEDMKQLRREIDFKTGNAELVAQQAEAEYDKDSIDPAKHLTYGQTMSAAGKPELAEAAFRRAVELAPNLPQAWLALIGQLHQSKKTEELLKVVQDAQIKLPEDRRNAILGPGYEAVGDQTQAEQYYKAALEAAPNDILAQRTLAAYYLRTNRRQEAETQLDLIMKATPSSQSDRESVTWARRTKAQLLATAGDYRDFQKALELLTPAGRKPTAEDLSARLALLFERTDATSSRQALRVIDELKKLRPLSVQERIGIAKLHERLGDWTTAREEMNSLLASASSDPTVRLIYAEMLLRRGNVDDAESHVNALRNASTQYTPQMAMMHAKILAAKNKGAEAATLLSKLLGAERPVRTEMLPLLSAIAAALEEIQQYEPAEKFLREYVSYERSQVLRLATFLARRGKVDAALELVENFRNAFPTPQLLSVGMAGLRQTVVPPTPAQIARVEQWITSSAQEDPNSYQLQLVLADLRDYQQNYTEAEKVYRAILSRSDVPAQSRAEVMNNLAFILAMQGREVDEAVKLINEAVAIYGPHSDMLDTRGLVNIMKGDTKQAVADLTDAVTTTDPKPIKFVHLAMAQAAAKDLAGAKRSLDKAKTLKFSRDDLSPLEKAKFEELLKQLNMTV